MRRGHLYLGILFRLGKKKITAISTMQDGKNRWKDVNRPGWRFRTMLMGVADLDETEMTLHLEIVRGSEDCAL